MNDGEVYMVNLGLFAHASELLATVHQVGTKL